MKIIRIVKLIIILCLLQFINSINEKEKSKQIFPHEIIDSHVTINPTQCACAQSFPPCCTPEFKTYQCGCSMRPSCPMCSVENMFVNLHDNNLRNAMKDAYDQQSYTQKAKLQVDLFEKAQKFAKEVGIQEMKAKNFARLLKDATKKAQLSRMLMFEAATKVKLLAEQTFGAVQPIECRGERCSEFIHVDNDYTERNFFNDEFSFKEKKNNFLK